MMKMEVEMLDIFFNEGYHNEDRYRDEGNYLNLEVGYHSEEGG